MNEKFVRNAKTGQVLRWNPHLSKKPHIVPHTPHWMKPDTQPPTPTPDTANVAIEVPGVGLEEDSISISDAPVGDEPEQAGDPELLPKDEADSAVKEFFGKDVSKVTVAEMIDKAKTLEADIPWEKPTKLQLITAIAAKQGNQE